MTEKDPNLDDIPSVGIGQGNIDKIVKRYRIKQKQKDFSDGMKKQFPSRKKDDHEKVFKAKHGIILGKPHTKELSKN